MKKEKSNIAVSALIHKDGKFLLLKRNNPPFKWGPPAGRVFRGEGILDALKREVKEEASINVKIIMPIAIWEGEHDDQRIISFSFLCEYNSGEIKVSEEHTDARWFNLSELKEDDVTHNLDEFIRAKEINRLFELGKIQ
ncbi:MAG: NUDIX hydrolase [Promethearchaeota archaeon]